MSLLSSILFLFIISREDATPKIYLNIWRSVSLLSSHVPPTQIQHHHLLATFALSPPRWLTCNMGGCHVKSVTHDVYRSVLHAIRLILRHDPGLDVPMCKVRKTSAPNTPWPSVGTPSGGIREKKVTLAWDPRLLLLLRGCTVERH